MATSIQPIDLELVTHKAIDMAFASGANDSMVGPIAAALITQALTQSDIKDALLEWKGREKAK